MCRYPESTSRRKSRCTRRRPHYGFSRCSVSLAAAAGELGRSAHYDSHHWEARWTGCPEGARYLSPGQASHQASGALGWLAQESLEPCRGETVCRKPGPFASSPRLFRPVGAMDELLGRPTQGDAPRRLGACPGLSYAAPLGLRPPNQITAPNAGGRRRFAIRMSLAARVGECFRSA
jgi:hypothetical protein